MEQKKGCDRKSAKHDFQVNTDHSCRPFQIEPCEQSSCVLISFFRLSSSFISCTLGFHNYRLRKLSDLDPALDENPCWSQSQMPRRIIQKPISCRHANQMIEPVHENHSIKKYNLIFIVASQAIFHDNCPSPQHLVNEMSIF